VICTASETICNPSQTIRNPGRFSQLRSDFEISDGRCAQFVPDDDGHGTSIGILGVVQRESGGDADGIGCAVWLAHPALRLKVTPVRTTTKIAAGGLVGLASLFGSGSAHADSNQEKEACQLMDDPTGPQLGYAPAEYAFMQPRAKMSAEDARNVMSLAAQDYCPNHITDLPASWR